MNKRETITLVYFRNRAGHVRTRRISVRVLKGLVIAFFAVFILSGVSTYFAADLYLKRLDMLEGLRAVKMEKKAFETRLLSLQRGEGESLARAGEMEEQGKSRDRTETVVQKVVVKNLRIFESGSDGRFRVSFDVAKKDMDGERASGFVVILGKAGEQYFALPRGVEIKDGLPEHYQQGERFVIRYRKPFEYHITYPIDSIENLEIFVYADDGALVLKHPAAVQQGLRGKD